MNHIVSKKLATKRHRDWDPAPAQKRSIHALKIHCIWKHLRTPFLLPESICLHQEWEVYDIQYAGCKTCGCMHSCSQGTEQCPTEKNAEGHEICCITGLCIKMLSFSEHEFLDTVNYAWQDQTILITDASAPTINTKRQKNEQKHEQTAASPMLDPAVKYMSSYVPHGKPIAHYEYSSRCSVNKKNRYRSWVHHRIQVNFFHFLCIV